MPTLFKADLLHTKAGTPQELSDLKDFILKTKAEGNTNTVNLSNPGCWRMADFPVENYKWLFESIKGLVEKAHTEYLKEDPVYAGHVSLDNSQINAWVNVNDPGSRNMLHSHYATYSGTFYIQTDGTGSLRFCNPALTLSNQISDSPFSRDFYVDPKDGDLLLWPSWVPHEVEPNLSANQRINIAYDVYLNSNVR